ncbi:hypothetical protein CYLTODRAFT_424566 [Cylindrobasidium torrendii FP15055 ss-10]|uniref:Uncharacterized protein n=1 Tax=Cylindrobasidium torrendii FP15055 ss-10 TaxID=1314674 RepID=A0A0D7B4U7_9AGAR|nr:hypothetical protein CYLTODRAFT_424566 [Cylindrobasidium torrendii FP15055 ss-10]
MDDAFHREWCGTCLTFCVQRLSCKRHDPTPHEYVRSYLYSLVTYISKITRVMHAHLWSGLYPGSSTSQ